MNSITERDSVIDAVFKWLWINFNNDIAEKASTSIRQKWQHFDFQVAASKYISQIEEQCGTMQIWRMAAPTRLEDIFTNVNILDKPSAFQRKPKDQLEKMFLFQDSFGTIIESEKDGIESVYDHNRLFILGKPGSGKTTFSKYVAIQSFDGKLDRIPVFISLKNFSESGKSLKEYIFEQFDVCRFPDTASFIEIMLQKARHYKLTDYSLKKLEGDKIPKAILKNLKSLKGQIFWNQNEYLKALRRVVGTKQYKKWILKQLETSENEIFTIHGNLFAPLQDEISDNLNTIQNHEYSTRSEFLEKLSTFISINVAVHG